MEDKIKSDIRDKVIKVMSLLKGMTDRDKYDQEIVDDSEDCISMLVEILILNK